MRNPDGSSSVSFQSLSFMESTVGRQEVHGWAVDTFLQQHEDRLDVKRRAQEAADPAERARCREAVLSSPAPSLEECLRYSRRQRRIREVDHPSTILDG